MAPSSLSAAMGKMPQPVRTSSQDSDNIRKRVCKACDRCRLKKSKCDGSHPCTRCKADNAICVFGERKKSQDKVYPKGYVEMLEQQQAQLVSALQEMYQRATAGQGWSGAMLQEVNGQPLTHDILAALDLLEPKHDGSGDVESFEEDYEKLQSRLLADGAGYVQHRRGSFSSESEHSQHGQTHLRTASKDVTSDAKLRVFRQDSASSACTSPSLAYPSPIDQPRMSVSRPPLSSLSQHSSDYSNDPQLYRPEWYIPDMTSQAAKQRYALLMPEYGQPSPEVDAIFDSDNFDMSYDPNFLPIPNLPQQFAHAFTSSSSNMAMMQDFALDPMDLELNRYVPVTS